MAHVQNHHGGDDKGSRGTRAPGSARDSSSEQKQKEKRHGFREAKWLICLKDGGPRRLNKGVVFWDFVAHRDGRWKIHVCVAASLTTDPQAGVTLDASCVTQVFAAPRAQWR